MPFNPDNLLKRTLITDRNRDVAFYHLDIQEIEPDILIPLMLYLANIADPQVTYLLPLGWMEEDVLLKKLSKNTVLLTNPLGMSLPIAGKARDAGFRIAVEAKDMDSTLGIADFYMIPFTGESRAGTDTILRGIDTLDVLKSARDCGALYFEGNSYLDRQVISHRPNIHPAHITVMELISAVQRDANPTELETLFKQDVTLSFKLLRYINSPFFGLNSKVESVKHACSILGYQPLLKWLTLIAATAGEGASPSLTRSAMIRARLMELLGAKFLDKQEQEHLFIIGMFSLLDRIMQTPLELLLIRANLPPQVGAALLENSGRFVRFLNLATACEGVTLELEEESQYADFDVKFVNAAHLDAIEWATAAIHAL